MKRKFSVISLMVIIILLFSSIGVLAAPAYDKPTPNSNANNAAAANAGNQGQKKGKVQNFKGVVAEKGATSLTLTLKDGSTATVMITDGTKVKIPAMKNATVEDITANSQAVVQARVNSAGEPVAQKILVIPGKPTKIHRVGVVTAYTAGSSITVQGKDGETTTFSLAPGTKILPAKKADGLAVGAKVTIISRRDPAGGAPAAQGIVVHGAKNGDD